MKLSTIQLGVALFVAAVPVLGADCTSVALTAIPSCAQPCFLDGAPTIGCDGLDFACQCRQEAALYAAIENCVATSCQQSEFQKVIDGAATVCQCANGGSSGNQGSVTVSGSYVPSPSAPPPSVQPPPATTPSVQPPSATPPPATTTAPSDGGDGGDGDGGIPPQSTPSYFATVINGADRQMSAGHGPIVFLLAAALGFAML